MQTFDWSQVQRREDGKILLLYRHQRVFDEGFVKPDQEVLDVGGWGMLAQAINEAGARCTILDLFTVDQLYPERVRALPHVEGDVRNFATFEPRSFDLVTCFEMLEHSGDVHASLVNIHTWLKPGGWLVGTVPHPGRVHGDDPAVRDLSQEDIKRELKAAGFAEIHVEPTGSINTTDEPHYTWFKGTVHEPPTTALPQAKRRR